MSEAEGPKILGRVRIPRPGGEFTMAALDEDLNWIVDPPEDIIQKALDLFCGSSLDTSPSRGFPYRVRLSHAAAFFNGTIEDLAPLPDNPGAIY